MSDISVRFTKDFPLWIIIPIIVIIALFAYLSYRNPSSPIPKRVKALLITLRFLSISIPFLCLLSPILAFQAKSREKPVVAIMIDSSESMGIKDLSSSRRIDVANRILHDKKIGLIERLNDRFNLRFYEFSQEPTQIDVPFIKKVTGDSTDIEGCIRDVVEDLADEPLSSIIILTDGGDNVGEHESVKELGIPIYPIGIGKAEIKDIEIKDVSHPKIAYIDTTLPIDVVVRSKGFKGVNVPLLLKQGERIIKRQGIRLQKERTITIRYTPKKEGLIKFTVSIPKMGEELVSENNSKSFFIRIVKKGIRVLYIDRPRFECTFLKRVLERDKNISLTFIPKIKDHLQPLTHPLSIKRYDVIILGDIERGNFKEKELNDIVNFVDEGGGFIMLGGNSFSTYSESPIEKILPVKIGDSEFIDRPFKLELTREGAAHPIMELDIDRNERLFWDDLPYLYGYNKIFGIKKGAVVLAVNNEKEPIFSIQRYGKGKTAVLTTPSTWRWGFQESEVYTYYNRFWINVIRWLDTPHEVKLVNLLLERDVYPIGEEVTIKMQVLSKEYSPIDGASVFCEIDTPKENVFLNFTQDKPGEYKVDFLPNIAGRYKVKGEAFYKGVKLGKDEIEFVVEAPNLEFKNPYLNRDLLLNIARESKGKYYSIDEVSKIPTNLKKAKRVVFKRYEIEVWDTPIIFLMFITLLGSEWILRKRFGLV